MSFWYVFVFLQSDMAAERVITHEEGEKLAKVWVDVYLTHIHKWSVNSYFYLTSTLSFSLLKQYGVPFMETSAKTGVNVELAFQAIARSETLFIQSIWTFKQVSLITIDHMYSCINKY